MIKAAEKIGKHLDGSVLIKGGHLTETADDLLWHQGDFRWYKSEVWITRTRMGQAVHCPLPLQAIWHWGIVLKQVLPMQRLILQAHLKLILIWAAAAVR